MKTDTVFEWADHTFTPWVGVDVPVRTGSSQWRDPIRWNAGAAAFSEAHGRRQRVCCSSLVDWAGDKVDQEIRDDLFDLIEATSNLDWMLLTSHPESAAQLLERYQWRLLARLPSATWPPTNLWQGVTVKNQKEANHNIIQLLRLDAHKRFVSLEPLLGPVDLSRIELSGGTFDALLGGEVVSSSQVDALQGLNCVIVGGEVGPQARPMHPEWVRDLRDQCLRARVPLIFKHWGEWAPGSGDFGGGAFKTAAVSFEGSIAPGGFEAHDYPHGATAADRWAMVHRAAAAAAGRLVDGRKHDGSPV